MWHCTDLRNAWWHAIPANPMAKGSIPGYCRVKDHLSVLPTCAGWSVPVSPLRAQHALNVLRRLNIPDPPFSKRKLNAGGIETQIMHGSCRKIETMIASTPGEEEDTYHCYNTADTFLWHWLHPALAQGSKHPLPKHQCRECNARCLNERLKIGSRSMKWVQWGKADTAYHHFKDRKGWL